MKNSPALHALFLKGTRLSRPFQGGDASGGNGNGSNRSELEYLGRKHPTYFRLKGQPYGKTYHRNCEKGRRARIHFETDVVNDYFKRGMDGGSFSLELLEPGGQAEPNYSVSLENGAAHLNMELPADAEVGDEVLVETTVSDQTLLQPFVNLVKLSVLAKHDHPPSTKATEKRNGSGKGDRPTQSGIALPGVVPVHEKDVNWINFHFTPETACHVISELVEGSKGLQRTFYINVDNISLLTEMKHSRENPRLMEAKFKYANVLLGLGLLHADDQRKSGGADPDEEPTIEDHIRLYSQAVAPVLLPMINELSGLDEAALQDLGIMAEDD